MNHAFNLLICLQIYVWYVLVLFLASPPLLLLFSVLFFFGLLKKYLLMYVYMNNQDNSLPKHFCFLLVPYLNAQRQLPEGLLYQVQTLRNELIN